MGQSSLAIWMVPLLGVLSMFQASLTSIFTIYGVKPDLVLLVILTWTLLFGSASGLIWAFVGGVWLDIFSGGPMGASSLALMTASLLGGVGHRSLSRFNILVPVFIVILGSLTFSFIYLSILEVLDLAGWFSGSLEFLPAVESIVIPSMLYNTCLMLLVIPFLNRRPDGAESGLR